MSTKMVMLADNDKEARETWGEVLRDAGYQVEEASSFTAAKKLLQEGGQDLAVLDLHLRRGDRKDDLGGLELANEAYGRSVVPVILTGDVTGEALAREHQAPDSIPDIVQKSGGPKPLLKALRKAESTLKAIRPAVFLSHGHDPDARKAVADFLTKGKMQVVVLQDQTSGGSQHILHKLESYSNVQFAVVLVTPDDVGGQRMEPLDPKTLRHRARQNVIFELGYLIGRLGQSRVVALFKEAGEEIERPSNYNGVVFLEMDGEGEWRSKLAREIKRALTLVRDL